MNKVFVVGMGLGLQDVTAVQMEIIQSADILIGARRHLDHFREHKGEKKELIGKIAETVDYIQQHRQDRRIVVLASGDPLFFGIGSRILRELGPEDVTLMPNVTSIAGAFARIKEPWNDAAIISLHGRNRRFELLHAVKTGKIVAVLTEPGHNPPWLAQWLLDRGLTQVRMAVCETMGSEQESFAWYTLEQAAAKTFVDPNVVVLKSAAPSDRKRELTMGMSDSAFRHDAGMITKAEVRAVTLAKLRLSPGLTLWDLGAGSGSVGIEASVLLGAGRIVAVEQDSRRVAQIRHNARQFGVFNHEVIQARLPLGLEALPRPDRIFIGGGGRRLVDILQAAAACLKPGGVVVINTVLVDNLARITDALASLDMDMEMVQIQVNKSKEMPWSRRLEAQNAVWIISAQRKADQA